MPARFSLAACLLLSSLSLAAQAQSSQPSKAATAATFNAHIPSALLSAKTIFLSNADTESRGYEDLYAQLTSSGHQLVDDPSQADLVLEPHLLPGGVLRLTIYDRKTHFTLWTLTETIQPAALTKTYNKNYDKAAAKITSEFDQLTTQPPSNRE